MAFHNLLGKAGEQAAADFLIKQGLTIRETNWRVGKLEIDIIASDANMTLHIVEVKTRTSDAHFDPMKSINRKKIMNLIHAARGYMRYYDLKMGIQFDVMIIVGAPEHFKITYIPKAFTPPLRTYR